MKGGAPTVPREEITKHLMETKEHEFTEVQHFTVCAATWNVNGKSPPPVPVVEWLATDIEPPDIYAVGFQELDLATEAHFTATSNKEEEWRRVISQSLHPNATYKEVRLVRLVGIMLIVYVKSSHVSHVRNVSDHEVATGILGYFGNKGGVAVRLDFHNTSLCFVCSHLAAHQTEVDRRNQDYQQIMTGLQQEFISRGLKINDTTDRNRTLGCDQVFWVGDLNYRLNELDANDVKTSLHSGKYQQLFLYDQLNIERRKRRCFEGFEEGPIEFQPTYKYDPGTDDWDTSEKQRAPAWTDRILWKGNGIEQLCYRSHPQLQISDHKPVTSLLRSGVKVVDRDKERRVYEEIMKQLDKQENEYLPQVMVDTNEITFAEGVRFMEGQTSYLTAANTGAVPVEFEFIKKDKDKTRFPAWLSVEPSNGFIMPGDKVDIKVEVYVGKRTAGSLTSGQAQLYDILVLHLRGGKDIFVTVSGDYVKSSFGSSLDALCRLTVPIRDLCDGSIIKLEKGQPASEIPEIKNGDGEPYPVPKELWYLCEKLTKMGLDKERPDKMFLTGGIKSEIRRLIDWLDTGLPPEGPTDVSIHSVAETLLLFLDSLRVPVIPDEFYRRCLDAAENEVACTQLMSALPPRHREVFNYLCQFLKEVFRVRTQNGLDPKAVAPLFAKVMLRDPPSLTTLGARGLRARAEQHELENRKLMFLSRFLEMRPVSPTSIEK